MKCDTSNSLASFQSQFPVLSVFPISLSFVAVLFKFVCTFVKCIFWNSFLLHTLIYYTEVCTINPLEEIQVANLWCIKYFFRTDPLSLRLVRPYRSINSKVLFSLISFSFITTFLRMQCKSIFQAMPVAFHV